MIQAEVLVTVSSHPHLVLLVLLFLQLHGGLVKAGALDTLRIRTVHARAQAMVATEVEHEDRVYSSFL
ncbi:hypothetical protein K474DRAFT_1670317 [Panus rudis PR-1116 ss-1]|nr:hypothetical protein K474DRAFT_1670317 [Panus rudis PR-1116 ss-1]